MKSIFNILILAFSLASFEAQATESCKQLSTSTNSDTKIYFINGINNTQKEAVASLNGLCQTLFKHGIKNIKAEVLYNPKGALDLAPASTDDLGELSLQAQISADARAEVELLGNPKSNALAKLTPTEKYYYNLGVKYINGKDGASGDYPTFNEDYKIFGVVREATNIALQQLTKNTNVVLVAHSQGNFVAEAVYATIFAQSKDASLPKAGLSSEQYAAALKRLRVVGVAPVAATSPHNNYVLATQDFAVNVMLPEMLAQLRPNTSKYFSVLDSNIQLCELSGKLCHAFDSYQGTYSSWRNLKLSADKENNGHGFDKFYNSDSFRNQGTGATTATMLASMISTALEELTGTQPSRRYEVITCGTWDQCRVAALAKGGQLVTIRSQTDNNWLEGLFPMSNHYWIGATNNGEPGAWHWVSGESFGYSNWGGNLNNLGGNESCAHFYSVTPGFWNDLRCDAPDVTKAIVEYPNPIKSGSLTVLANTIPGATLSVPALVTHCTFNSSGNWSAGPQAPLQYQNADGVVGGTSFNLTNDGVPIPSAPNMTLVVKHKSTGLWELLGSSKTIAVVAGENLSFMMNDATTFGYTDGNTGYLTTTWSCQ
jgi:Lectin C-type domain